MKYIYTLLLSIFCLNSLQAQTLKILSYNIHHGQNEAGVMDVDGLANYINSLQPDLVALQEVDSFCNRSNQLDIMQILGQKTGMFYYFGKAMPYSGGGYGEGFLSRYPVANIKTVALPIALNSDHEPRAAIEAVITLDAGKKLKIIATHLDHEKDPSSRNLQTAYLQQLYAQEPMPFIIIGDLNAQPTEPAMQSLYNITNIPKLDKLQFTFNSQSPTKKIDYILLSKNHNWNCKSYTVLEQKTISDHRPIMAIIKM